jgi:hypothetical protein
MKTILGQKVATLRLLTAVLFATASTAAYAASVTKTYTFAHADGTPYCEGIQLYQTGDFDSGDIFGISCQETIFGLGFKAKVPGAAVATWNFIYTDLTGQYLIALDERAKTWAAYYESSYYDIPFTQTGGGLLLKGQQAARPGASSITAQLRAKALLAPRRN